VIFGTVDVGKNPAGKEILKGIFGNERSRRNVENHRELSSRAERSRIFLTSISVNQLLAELELVGWHR
jgi:hypothetical protein